MALKQAKSTKDHSDGDEQDEGHDAKHQATFHLQEADRLLRSFVLPGITFLDLIEAPQWIDLSEEATLSMDNERYDSWFDESHRHHVISLAGKNSDMTWLRLNNSKRADEVEVTSLARNAMKKCQQSAPKINFN